MFALIFWKKKKKKRDVTFLAFFKFVILENCKNRIIQMPDYEIGYFCNWHVSAGLCKSDVTPLLIHGSHHLLCTNPLMSLNESSRASLPCNTIHCTAILSQNTQLFWHLMITMSCGLLGWPVSGPGCKQNPGSRELRRITLFTRSELVCLTH